MDTKDDEIRDDILTQPVIKRRITEQDVRSIHHSLNSLTFKPKKSIKQRILGRKRKFRDVDRCKDEDNKLCDLQHGMKRIKLWNPDDEIDHVTASHTKMAMPETDEAENK